MGWLPHRYGPDGKSWSWGPFRYAPVSDSGSVFMDRYAIGRLWVHIFRRADKDVFYHDHEWDFYTFPLKSYVEEVLVVADKDLWYENKRVLKGERYVRHDIVRAWRWHKRKAEHAHRIVATYHMRRWPESGYRPIYWNMIPSAWDKSSNWPVITICWKGKPRRNWGAWQKSPHSGAWGWTPASQLFAKPALTVEA